MATFYFFFFKIWQLVTSFSSKYGDFRNFLEQKKCLSTIRIGFFFGRQNTKINWGEKKKPLQVVAFSLIFLFQLFCASHISFVQKFHA
jgi:hypothetical protein